MALAEGVPAQGRSRAAAVAAAAARKEVGGRPVGMAVAQAEAAAKVATMAEVAVEGVAIQAAGLPAADHVA